MSELSSLYMRIRITEKNLNTFRQSPAVAPRHYTDWLPWLATRSYYGDITDQAIQVMEPPEVAERSPLLVDDYLAYALESEGVLSSGAARSAYDQAANTWTLCILEFGENFGDFIQELSILRAVSRFKDLPGEDFIVVYPFLWAEGSDADAYLVITQGISRFEVDVPDSVINEAAQHLNQLLQDSDPRNQG